MLIDHSQTYNYEKKYKDNSLLLVRDSLIIWVLKTERGSMGKKHVDFSFSIQQCICKI